MATQEASLTGLEAAIAEAVAGFEEGGVPIGAALEVDGRLVGRGHNRRVQDGDPTAHGEIACLRAAGRVRSYAGAVLYTTLAPCAMCAGAIAQFGIGTVVVGENTTFPGELEFLAERGVRVIVENDKRCIELMQRFQRESPDVWAEDIGESPPER